MNILVLAAGRGQRFKDEGYEDPKPLIDVNGHPMIVRCTDSLPFIGDHLAIAYLGENDGIELTTYHWLHLKKMWYGNDVDLIKFDKITRGNLETAYISIESLIGNVYKWDLDEPLLILDADNIYDDSGFEEFLIEVNTRTRRFGAICYFDPIDNKSHWCFAKVDDKLNVLSLAEKDPFALQRGEKPVIGTFYFSSARLFMEVASTILLRDKRESGEFYMSQAFKELLNRGIPVYGHKVADVRPVGTPLDLKKYLRGPLTVALDLDDTINYCKEQNEEYGNEIPQEQAIETLKMWKRRGYYIIITTARHMNTCAGNQGKVLALQGLTTLQWLEDNEVPYDEIWWSKPHADVFIDDKAFRHEIGDWDRTADWIDKFAEGEVS